jgi:hypothetical protein
MSKANIAAAIALGRTPFRRAAAPAEEEALTSTSPAETAAIADSNAETLLRSNPRPEAWAGTEIIRDAWDATKLGAIAEKKKPGPQRRTGTFLKRIFTLDRDMSDYVNEAWRSYRTRDGHLVDSMSEFVNTILAEHRDKHSR